MSDVIERRQSAMIRAFQARYSRSPTHWTRAPGRVDLMGSHTDYNMGHVMTLAIDRDTWLAAAPRLDQRIVISSMNVPGVADFSLDDIRHDDQVTWSNYVRGVASALRAAGYALGGFDGLIHSTLPIGSGLSSSAALEMSVGILFQALGKLAISPLELAVLGKQAENEFVGVKTGILDQYSSVMGQEGQAICLDCRHLTSELVAINHDLYVVICNTCSQRSLVGSEYDDRRAQCEEGVSLMQVYYPTIAALRDVTPDMFTKVKHTLPEIVRRRCQFILEENQRVLDLLSVLPAGEPGQLQTLFTSSYYGARDLYEIGSSAMAAMFQAMIQAPGIVAARQAGAGFGGSMVALVESDLLEPFCEDVTTSYLEATGIQPEVYPVRAAAGAGILQVA